MKPILSAVIIGAASLTQATVIDTFPDWDGNTTFGWDYVAQSFTAPSDSMLLSWTFGTANQGNLGFDIVAWNNAYGPDSGSLYSTTVNATGGGVFTVSDINLALAPGNLYAVVYHTDGVGDSIRFQVNQNSYNAGDASWADNYNDWQYLNSNWNTQFRAEFGPVPEPTAFAVLGFGALLLLRRRR